MSFIGSFGMFTTVRLGIYTSQQGLNLTGNNIANINTVGYTRQTLNIQSLNATGVDRYTDSNTRIGSGAYVTGISQMRDPYLDIRYRTECASVGYMDTKLSNLNDLAAILDEVGDGDDENGIISAQLSDLLASLENLTEYTGQGEFDTQVRSSAASLVALFNSYATKLDEVEVNAVDRFKKDLVTINELLTNIKSLNTNIRKCDIHGSPALEMRDERNRLIDELSQFIKIDVEYTTERIGPATEVEKLSIKLAGSYPGTYLVDGIYGGQLQLDDTMAAVNPSYNSQAPRYLDSNGNPTDLTHNPEYDPNALPYLDADGNPTNDGTITGTRNPLSFPYIDKDGKPTDQTINPNYDPAALPYLDAAGLPTNDDTITGIRNPQSYRYIGTDGNLTDTEIITGTRNPLSLPYVKYTANPAYDPNDADSLPYLDKNGNPVKDIADAAYTPVATIEEASKIANSNYNLTLTKLVDSKGNVKTDYKDATRVDFDDTTTMVTINGQTIDVAAQIAALGDETTAYWTVDGDNGQQMQYTLRQITDGTTTSYTLVQTEAQLSVDLQLDDNATYGSLQAAREFLTESGEFATEGYTNLVDPGAAGKRGIRYYKNALDLLAKKFADTMNEANNGFRYAYDENVKDYCYVDEDGKTLIGPDGQPMIKKASLDATEIAYLELNGSRPESYGVLFSNRGDNNDGSNITASNITISANWASGEVQIVNSYEVIPGTNKIGSTDNTNVLHMVTLMNKDLSYTPADLIGDSKKDSMFIGSFGEMLGNINAVLGNDQKSTEIMLNNYYESAVELDTSRDSVSSVDLNDETVNMIQYQKSYSAACRLMTTMDEILDKLINGTGVAGR